MAEQWRGNLINETKGKTLKLNDRTPIAFASSTNTSQCLFTEEMTSLEQAEPLIYLKQHS